MCARRCTASLLGPKGNVINASMHCYSTDASRIPPTECGAGCAPTNVTNDEVAAPRIQSSVDIPDSDDDDDEMMMYVAGRGRIGLSATASD